MSANQPGITISIIPQNIASSYQVTMTETATGTVIITMTPVIQPYNTPPSTPPHIGAGADIENSDSHTSEGKSIPNWNTTRFKVHAADPIVKMP
ncbi:hypothetical protein GE21DRAFT_10403 [Neurospora crassa]|uniref:Uncharacterized protein n=1 Tax=Neurospora crassa (strain ATCC 24698 / 74-OR23-1A / CBS 708.71 / DSM 1257 / FGSC 987) TaxID=367110 RepID=Q7S564_NEUCR|nr:hypothetical protein NCU02306 [Neurospora crassa OR74A]EAA30714.1 hypothetical protein NCU02306 [Neurospora crassa OR74A]KHE84816.1 hypothetical protein GE21DRAFT_10403 [Neurospora crassa]|eukprot:XP_959950.1 hypothetical protein NCU02306 [Neurospora crassa OR74A]